MRGLKSLFQNSLGPSQTNGLSFRKFETRLPNGREPVPNSIPSRGHHEVIVIPGFETVKSP